MSPLPSPTPSLPIVTVLQNLAKPLWSSDSRAHSYSAPRYKTGEASFSRHDLSLPVEYPRSGACYWQNHVYNVVDDE
uniref:Uncharacterized protein n=1 Tax=Physcomitrium patens TaxID=3218 RepID=A0A2K1L7G4_PHYPA|nr:hypothetical protein PHYPA_000409 [Physcomitrium patens]